MCSKHLTEYAPRSDGNQCRGVLIPALNPSDSQPFGNSGSGFKSSKKQNCNTYRDVLVLALDLNLMSDFSPLAIPDPVFRRTKKWNQNASLVDNVHKMLYMYMCVLRPVVDNWGHLKLFLVKCLFRGPIDNINCISEMSQPLNYSHIFSHSLCAVFMCHLCGSLAAKRLYGLPR